MDNGREPQEAAPQDSVAPQSVADLKNRLTIVESIYHQVLGDQPEGIECRFSRELESDEQPYSRKLKATEEWKPLDCGWIEKVGMLHIENVEGKHLQTIPTEEEQQEINSRVLLICCDDGSRTFHSLPRKAQWIVLPGESMRAYPCDARSLYVRASYDTVRFSLHVYPL